MRLLYLICLITCLIVFNNLHAKELTISTGEYKPLSGKKIYRNGFVLDVIRKAFKKSGYSISFKFYPWARAYKELLDNNVDAGAFYYDSKKRREKCYYSNSFFAEKTVFYYNVKKPLEKWEKLEDLKEFKIGATLGYTYTDRFWDLSKMTVLKVYTSNSDVHNLKKLVNGRIDLFPSSIVRTNYLINKEISKKNLGKIKYHERPLRYSNTHLLFLKKSDRSKKLLKDFNEGLKKIREDGTYDNMLLELKETFNYFMDSKS